MTDSTGKILSTALNTVALAQGGLGASLSDPNADKLLAWDDTDNSTQFISLGSGLSYDHSTHTLSSTGGPGGGDASTNTSTSVDSEIALFSGTGGKTLKRATQTGILKASSGVIAAAVSGTDYAAPGANTDITSVLLDQTGLVIKGATSNALTIKPNETLSAGRTLNLIVNDVSRTIDLSGNLTVNSGGATVGGTNTGDQNLFASVAVSGQTTVTTASPTQALTLVAGSNVTITTDNTAKSVTIAASGGGGSPGGANTQVQYNNSSALGGITGFTTDGTNVTAGSGNLRATSPQITTDISDANGNEIFKLTATASAVNEVTVANAATGNSPTFTASGSDTDIGFKFVTKNSGVFVVKAGVTANQTLARFQNAGGSDLLAIGTNGISLNNAGDGMGIRYDGGSWALSAGAVSLGNNVAINYSSTANWYDTPDGGLARSAANFIKPTNGSTGGGGFDFKEISTPSNPAADHARLYAKDNGSSVTKLYYRDSAGTETEIGAGGGGVADPGSNGLMVRTALNTTTAVSIAVGSASLTVSNADGTGGNPTLDTAQDIRTTATPQFARLGIGGAAASITSVKLTGPTINTDADNTVAVVDSSWSLTKNDSNTRTFAGWQIKPTLNAGASNLNTTVNLFSIDSTNTSVTGLTTNLIKASYGGSEKFKVASDGTVTLATALTSGNGGTGNGFTKFSGPASSEKTFTLPNASANILTDNAAVTVAQGGTGLTSGTSGGVLYYSASGTIASSGALAASTIVMGGGAGAAPTTGGGFTVVAAGTGGNGPAYVGTATSLARSDHDHRSIHEMVWYFPGTPATGVQNLVLTFPDGFTNGTILDMRVSVNTTSASSSAFNIQRCTANCTGTSPTFSAIYSSDLSLGTNTRTAAKGSAPNQNVTSLVAGDQFKAQLVTIGASLADVTVVMTYKANTSN